MTTPPIGVAGPSYSSTFYSTRRRRVVGYTVAYPPGHQVGSALALVVMLHGNGGNHLTAIPRMTPAEALGLRRPGPRDAPIAMVTVDGGGGYWHPHADDDPMGMVVDELVPMLRSRGLGRRAVGTMGISMGGYGALAFAEQHPTLFVAVAAISPAIWTSFEEASAVNPKAFDSAAQFAAYDALTHAAVLRDTPVRIAYGEADPFGSGVAALAALLPRTDVVELTGGCHDGAFFTSQLAPSLAILATHLRSS